MCREGKKRTFYGSTNLNVSRECLVVRGKTTLTQQVSVSVIGQKGWYEVGGGEEGIVCGG